MAVVKVPGTDELLQIMTTDDEGNEKTLLGNLDHQVNLAEVLIPIHSLLDQVMMC